MSPTPPPGFSYIPDFLPPEEQGVLLKRLQSLDYRHDRFRGRALKRAYAQFGYAYVSTGRKLAPAPALPSFMTALIGKGLPYGPPGARFNQCIITQYPEGAGIGWHTDAELFDDCIMAVSLGAAARLRFRPCGATAANFQVEAAPGSLYVLEGPVRWSYQHEVVPVKAVRYSVTFRQVVAPG